MKTLYFEIAPNDRPPSESGMCIVSDIHQILQLTEQRRELEEWQL